MHLLGFVIVAFLSCALSTSPSTRVNKSTSKAELQPGNENTSTAIETLFIPEDPSKYEEIFGYVQKLLVDEEELANTYRDEIFDNSENSAKERNQTRKEPQREFEKAEVLDGRSKVSQETSANNDEGETTREEVFAFETDVNQFSNVEVGRDATENSTFANKSGDGDEYSTRDPAGIPSTGNQVELKENNVSKLLNEISYQNPDDERKTVPDEEDLLEVANFGLQAMHNLYYVKEPTLYSMGLYLDADNPARFVAAFNDQTEEARALAKYGFALLQSTTMFMKKFPDAPKELLLSRRSQRNPLQRHCPNRGVPECPPASLRYRTSDGSCNNLQHLWWGSAMSTMQRFIPPVYQDGIQSIRRSKTGRPLPSAREVSSIIHEDRDVPLASVTHMLMQWGQFVDHDLTATGQSRGFNGTIPQCCLNGGAGLQSPEFLHPECLPIPVNVQDSFFGPLGVRCLEFLRSGSAPREDCQFGPREQLTQVTSYLDASTVYSSNAFQSDSLRLFRNGLLQYGRIHSRRPVLPRQDSDLCKRGSLSTSCFRAGDGRLSEQPALTSLHIAFLRLHNRIATKLAALNFHWSDEKLFQETRRIVGAVVQHITYREFLPIVLGQDVTKIFGLEVLKKGYFEGYDPTVNPTVANGFSTAAYRFGHSLVQRSFVRFDSQHRPLFNNVSIHDEFSNPANLETAGSVDRLLLGLINQPSQRRDEFITEELTNHLFQTPRFPFGMDLASLNVQRGRDHGIPPYVKWREPCGLSPIKSFEDLNRVMSPTSARKFRILYSTVDDIDLFSAGLAENSVSGGLVGPTFACIIGQQFSNLRRGDRFWYENPGNENSFTAGQLQQIRRVSLAQVLCTTMDSIRTIQPFVFLTQDTLRNNRLSCEDPEIGELDLDFWAERPPESRTDDTFAKANRKPPTRHTTSRPTSKAQPASKDQEKLVIHKQKPLKADIHQQNRIIVKKPLGPPDNVTIVVQNNAVNSPVFVNDAIYGSHIRIHPEERYPPSTLNPSTLNPSTLKPPTLNPSTQRPFEFIDHRPIHQDTLQSIPPFPLYNQPGKPLSSPSQSFPLYTPAKPIPQAIPSFPGLGQHPKPIPTTIPSLLGLNSGPPYVPHGFDDPSNPNPLIHGFQTSYPSSDGVVFDDLQITSPRPTLYTYYTNFQRPTTERPQHQVDGHLVNYVKEQAHVVSRPDSWSMLEPNYQLPRPIYGAGGNSELHNGRPDNWQELHHQYSIGHENRPGNWNLEDYQNRPAAGGNWNYQNGGHPVKSRPYNYDDFNYHQERPTVNQNDYSTWSSVSSYPTEIGNDDPHGPVHQIRPGTKPVQADPDGWSTLPSYQKESPGRPATYHDAGTKPPYQAGFTGKPSGSSAPYQKPSARPGNDTSKLTKKPPQKYNTKRPASSSEALKNAPSYQRPFDQVQSSSTDEPPPNNFYQSSIRPDPPILDRLKPGPNYPTRPLQNENRVQSSSTVEPPPNNFYQSSIRPDPPILDRLKPGPNYPTRPVQNENRVQSSSTVEPLPNNFYQSSIRPDPPNLDRLKPGPNYPTRPIQNENRVQSSNPLERPSSPQNNYQVRPQPSELQLFEFDKNRKPSKVHSVTIVTETVETISQSGYRPDSVQNRVTGELPRPLLPELKNNRQGTRKPGQYYYEKNVLHRYPDAIEERHKTIVNETIAIDQVNLEALNETVHGENNGVTRSTIETGGDNRDNDDAAENLEGALSEETESTASPARTIYWLNPQENASLPSTLEMPRPAPDEIPSGAKELPRPITLKSHVS